MSKKKLNVILLNYNLYIPREKSMRIAERYASLLKHLQLDHQINNLLL